MYAITQVSKTAVATITPASAPAAYLTFFNSFSDPAKLIGLLVLVLQGVYVGIKIYKEIKNQKLVTGDD